MAVNHVDGQLFASLVAYPVIAAAASITRGASLLAIPAALIGFAVGLGFVTVGRWLIYTLFERVVGPPGRTHSHLYQWLIAGPVCILYLVWPWLITAAGFYSTWFGILWLVGQLGYRV